jgi:hypothetical protein
MYVRSCRNETGRILLYKFHLPLWQNSCRLARPSGHVRQTLPAGVPELAVPVGRCKSSRLMARKITFSPFSTASNSCFKLKYRNQRL